MKINKLPSKENYENLITRIYDVIDEYIICKNQEGWNKYSKATLDGMWQIADSVKNQLIITEQTDNSKTDINIEEKVKQYEELINNLNKLEKI